ncbi:hypothetical protein PRUPE_6G040600 [Prunus persica]|uniref:Uncharacterized protein n=1 Tax=Prunus persica TaxID=3760 RepID=A0A251NJX9_PRUPE|nr:hypothetical protein PRUPE_6G040600 [Prunus persica]
MMWVVTRPSNQRESERADMRTQSCSISVHITMLPSLLSHPEHRLIVHGSNIKTINIYKILQRNQIKSRRRLSRDSIKY